MLYIDINANMMYNVSVMNKNKYPQNQENNWPIHEVNPNGAKTVVLVGGITEGEKTLSPLAQELGKRDYRVISYDQTFGPADEIEGRAMMRHHTAKSRQLIDVVQNAQRADDEKLTLFAHSQGSVFALQAALSHPDKVERVILSNPAGFFKDAFPRLAGRFAMELTRKVATPKLNAQKQQIEGTKRMVAHPRDFMGDALDIYRSSVEQQVADLKEKGVAVDILLSNKDRVFPWRLQKDYFESQDPADYDFNSVSMYFNTKESGRQHRFASKWAGHDQPIIYPEQTAALIDQIIPDDTRTQS